MPDTFTMTCMCCYEGVVVTTHVNSQWYDDYHYSNLNKLVLRKEAFDLYICKMGRGWSMDIVGVA